jgi:protein involved in polysaccharide export with SLBB domain
MVTTPALAQTDQNLNGAAPGAFGGAQSAATSGAQGGPASAASSQSSLYVTPPAAPVEPIVIQSPNSGTPETLAPVTQPPAAGGFPPPLYARPGSAPGQFELFTRPPPQPGEFEAFVKKNLGRDLPRFGAKLILNGSKGFATPANATVPPDYRLNPGDELLVGVTGAVETNLRLTVDSDGRIFIPRVGPVSVAGARYGDLAAAITRRFAEQFNNVKVSVVISHLHGLTVYVTGYAVSPGAYTVSSLSTMVDAVLAAGGPAAGGSFRDIELLRDGRAVSSLDLYDLLLKGDKSHDAVLQNEDVLYLAPAGPEVAVTGSVNSEAIYEAKPGETLGDMIRDAGGLNSLADPSRVIVRRLADLDAAGSQQLPYDKALSFPAEGGDIVRILSLADVSRPQERQAILATIEGEVDHPGRYYLKPGSTMADLLAAAGGLTQGAFVYGAALDRESVRRQQEVSFERALDEMQFAAATAPLSSLGGVDAATASVRQAAVSKVIDQLRLQKPDGRLILPIPYGASSLQSDLPLENYDHINVPPRPKTVGVFGSVYEAGSFQYGEGTRLGDYLKLAGGARKHVSDGGQIFVVRANGSVLSTQQAHNLTDRPAYPGDVIYVPIRTGPSTLDKIKEISSIVFQFGLSAAAIAVLANQ